MGFGKDEMLSYKQKHNSAMHTRTNLVNSEKAKVISSIKDKLDLTGIETSIEIGGGHSIELSVEKIIESNLNITINTKTEIIFQSTEKSTIKISVTDIQISLKDFPESTFSFNGGDIIPNLLGVGADFVFESFILREGTVPILTHTSSKIISTTTSTLGYGVTGLLSFLLQPVSTGTGADQTPEKIKMQNSIDAVYSRIENELNKLFFPPQPFMFTPPINVQDNLVSPFHIKN